MRRYERGCTLAGVLYFHRISDPRMSGASIRNFNIFREICGDSTLQNVVIVTNKWGEVDPQLGEEREAELMRSDIFFKPVLDKGAQMARHQNTVPSAEEIIRLVLENHPLALKIQEELVDEHKDISRTGAGHELNRELNARIRRHQQEMHILREEVEQAIRDRDEETRRELEIETERIQREIARLQNDTTQLEYGYKERLGKCLEMSSEDRKAAEHVAVQYQQQIDELRNALQSNSEVSEREKVLILEKVDELSKRWVFTHTVGSEGLGFFSKIGAILQQGLGGGTGLYDPFSFIGARGTSCFSPRFPDESIKHRSSVSGKHRQDGRFRGKLLSSDLLLVVFIHGCAILSEPAPGLRTEREQSDVLLMLGVKCGC